VNGQTLLTIVGTFGVPSVVAALIAFWGVRTQTRAGQPKSNAEAGLAGAQAYEAGLRAQGGVVERLTTENIRLDKANQSLSQRLDVLEARFDDVTEQNQTLKMQNRLLSESLTRASDWMRRYYDAGHPKGMEPPPTFSTFSGG
jgi:hypothetical protein